MRGKTKVILATATVLFAAIAGYAILQRDNYSPTRALLVNDQDSAKLEMVKQYRVEIDEALTADPPILQVENPNDEQKLAFTALARDHRLPGITQDKNSNPYRIEVLQSYKLPGGQAVGQLEPCAKRICYRLDLYNFTLNTAILAVADLQSGKVLVLQASTAQPELSPRLADIATKIANNNEHVKKIMGDNGIPIMASTKTSLEKTVCDKSHHLCVAPTYVLADKKTALWVIVDLTDLKVTGVAWTKWNDKPEPLTERQLSTQAVDQSLCGQVVHEKRGYWTFDYTLTGSDGLEVRNVTYKGKEVVTSAKNVDWHVSYSNKDGFGYSDAIGCPVFSTAAVVPSGLPDVREEDGNVVLSVDFKGEKWPEPCNYFYRQQFKMNNDGSLRVVVANVGRGCGDDGTYRPVTRIQLPASAKEPKQAGKPAEKEMWWQPSDCEQGKSCPAMSYKVGSTAYDVIPGNGQFDDGGQGDNPFLYLSTAHVDRLEGQEDLLTLGSCCNANHEQGPEAFVDNESLAGKPMVLWYVAQLKNNGNSGQEYCWANSRVTNGKFTVTEYPCYGGPLLKPRGG